MFVWVQSNLLRCSMALFAAIYRQKLQSALGQDERQKIDPNEATFAQTLRHLTLSCPAKVAHLRQCLALATRVSFVVCWERETRSGIERIFRNFPPIRTRARDKSDFSPWSPTARTYRVSAAPPSPAHACRVLIWVIFGDINFRPSNYFNAFLRLQNKMDW